MTQKNLTKLFLTLIIGVMLLPNLQAKRKKVKAFETTIAGYDISILPRPENISMSNTMVRSFEVKEYSFDDNLIYIVENEFILNKMSYGFLNKANKIEIRETEVYINGKLTSGTVLEKSERVMLSGDHSFAETILGKYSVKVAPGSNLIMEDSDFIDGLIIYNYRVGNTNLRISGNVLEVNGDSYGELPEAAKIVVEEGVVSVNDVMIVGNSN